MKAVIQRVVNAHVSVDGTVISSIGRGLCVLIGISKNDTAKDMEYIVRKILNIRLFGEEDKRWMKSVTDMQFEILCCSQFTLHAVLKGNKPDFHQSMANEQSREFFQRIVAELRAKYKPDLVKEGQFGAYCNINILNDGPVTITLDSDTQGNGESAQKGQKTSKPAAATKKSPPAEHVDGDKLDESDVATNS